MLKKAGTLAVAAALLVVAPVVAQQQRPPAANQPRAADSDETLRPAPNRRPDEGKGPLQDAGHPWRDAD